MPYLSQKMFSTTSKHFPVTIPAVHYYVNMPIYMAQRGINMIAKLSNEDPKNTVTYTTIT